MSPADVDFMSILSALRPLRKKTRIRQIGNWRGEKYRYSCWVMHGKYKRIFRNNWRQCQKFRKKIKLAYNEQNIPPGKQIANRIVAAVLFEDSKRKKSISLALKAKKSTRKIKQGIWINKWPDFGENRPHTTYSHNDGIHTRRKVR